MKYALILLLLIFLVGCTESNPIVGNDSDIHGCKASAGYSWCALKEKCLRTWEEPCVESNEHICTAQESQATAYTLEYTPVCGKLVLNMGDTIYKTFGNGCGACAAMKVVSYTPGECLAETKSCSDNNGNTLTLDEAELIAKASECGDNLKPTCECPMGYVRDQDMCNPQCYNSTPRCLAPSIQCQETIVCNEGTGTYWIDLNITKEGCSPACVINLETRKAEINWRCTGALI